MLSRSLLADAYRIDHHPFFPFYYITAHHIFTGPKTNSVEMIGKLRDAGINVGELGVAGRLVPHFCDGHFCFPSVSFVKESKVAK